MLAQFQPQDTVPVVSPKEAIRVLHLVENLNDQAVETWLLRVLRGAAEGYPHLHWTFFCVLGKEGRLDETARRLGADVIHSQYEIGDKVRFVHSLRKVMKEGNYDILHCHHDVMSAAYLLASAGLPFQKRIVHVHNTSLSLPTPSRVKSELAREPMRQVCLHMADQIVGISKEALESLIGNGEHDHARHLVVHYAVDTARFSQSTNQSSSNSETIRRELGLKPSTKVLLFVGRIVEYKNPCFVVEILEHLAKAGGDLVAVFAGTGNQDSVIRKVAQQKSLEDRIRLLGFRDDVPELLLASDLLIWPSLEEPREGLGLGVVEAQAAGLPILMSRSVPDEAIVVSELVTVLPLAAGAKAWADAVLDILKRTRFSRKESLAKVESSSFSMSTGVSNMMALYEGLA